jgi:hypothetical protein
MDIPLLKRTLKDKQGVYVCVWAWTLKDKQGVYVCVWAWTLKDKQGVYVCVWAWTLKDKQGVYVCVWAWTLKDKQTGRDYYNSLTHILPQAKGMTTLIHSSHTHLTHYRQRV